MTRRHSVVISLAVAMTAGTPSFAKIAPGCSSTAYTPQQVTQAIQNSSYSNAALKQQACAFGGASQTESNGNGCEYNGSLDGTGNTGVLQLNNKSIRDAGYSPQQYANLPLQQQVDVWAKTVGNGNTSGAYGTLANSLGSSINGVSISQGTLAACFQFGPAICANDLKAMRANGACPAKGTGCTASPAGERRGFGRFCGAAAAELDDNGLSICTYAPKIQKQIDAANQSCGNKSSNEKSNEKNCPQGPGDFPTTPPPGTPAAALSA